MYLHRMSNLVYTLNFENVVHTVPATAISCDFKLDIKAVKMVNLT